MVNDILLKGKSVQFFSLHSKNYGYLVVLLITGSWGQELTLKG